jgi:hypothetical protein
LFCRKLVEAQEARKKRGVTQSTTMVWKINPASKGVVVNGSGNGISWITRTQGKKGARSISEKDQNERSRRPPRSISLDRPAWHPLTAPGAPLRLVSIYAFVNLCS